MKTMFERMAETIGNMSDEDMAKVERMLTGDFENDLLRRGDITEALRSLRCARAGDLPYQQALTDLARLMSNFTTHGERRRPGCYGGEAP
jgi:hypothetical protein